jgi:hypothetical protein
VSKTTTETDIAAVELAGVTGGKKHGSGDDSRDKGLKEMNKLLAHTGLKATCGEVPT